MYHCSQYILLTLQQTHGLAPPTIPISCAPIPPTPTPTPHSTTGLMYWKNDSTDQNNRVSALLSEHVEYRVECSFRLEKSCPQSQAALDWLNYVSATEHIFIREIVRGGKKIGGKKEPVDGFHAPSNTVYEFDGFLFVCFFFFFFHACSCILDCKSDDAKKQEQAVKAERTQQKHAYIWQLCYNLVVMKECQWRQLKQQNERVQSFFFKTHLLCTRGPLTASDILEFVQTGELFGILRVDIESPEHLKEMYSEMCPIFKNVDISLDDLVLTRNSMENSMGLWNNLNGLSSAVTLVESFAHHPSPAILSEAGLKSHPYLLTK